MKQVDEDDFVSYNRQRKRLKDEDNWIRNGLDNNDDVVNKVGNNFENEDKDDENIFDYC